VVGKIAANVLGLCDAHDLKKQKLNKAMKQNRNTTSENLHVSVGIAKPMLAVRAFSVEIVSDNPAEGLLSKETVLESELERYLSSNVPNCTVDLQRIHSDDRCKYFQHYMPNNKTTAKHSYKENHQLHKSGNFVKLYISEVFA